MTANALKICFLCHKYPPTIGGGIGSVVRTTARLLVKMGHEVRVIGMPARDKSQPAYEEDEGVRVWRMYPGKSRLGYWGRLALRRYQLFRQCAQWAKRGEIDLIEAPDYEGPVAGWPGLKIPVIVRLHGTHTFLLKDIGEDPARSMYRLENWGLQRADSLNAPSRYVMEETRNLFPSLQKKPMRVLYNTIPVPTTFEQRNRNRWRVVYSGSLHVRKGVIPLMQAWPAVVKAFPAAELHLYGKDSVYEGSSMRERLASMVPPECAGTVTFHGHIARPLLEEPLRTARVCIFPSYAESFCVAPVEAMAAGSPTIFTTRCTGREIIEDGKSGLLIDPDDIRSITDAIIRMLQDDQLAEKCAVAGYERARDLFSITSLLPQFVEYYAASIQEFKRARNGGAR